MPTAKNARFRRGLSLVAALALASSSVAMAAPGVATRNTVARSAPFKVAPVVAPLTSGTAVTADDQAINGWRRVELAGGKSGYVPDEDLKVEPVAPKPQPVAAPSPAAATAEPAPATAAAPEPVQPLRSIILERRTPQYVTDLSHLAELVKSDPEVFDLADEIATRRTTAAAVVGVGVVGGLVLRVLARTALQNETCTGTVPNLCVESDNTKLLDAGLALMVLGPLLGALFWPTRADQTRVINAWNTRHPGRPFVDGGGVEVP